MDAYSLTSFIAYLWSEPGISVVAMNGSEPGTPRKLAPAAVTLALPGQFLASIGVFAYVHAGNKAGAKDNSAPRQEVRGSKPVNLRTLTFERTTCDLRLLQCAAAVANPSACMTASCKSRRTC